jgi:alpha-tubulin suppressor-like RCC1 family protein
VQVTGIPAGIAAIASGSYFSCALTSKGAVWCWGLSGGGQLGAGPSLPNNNPVAVLALSGKAPLTGVAAISAGYADACALTNGGALLCWGENQSGEIGNNTNFSSNIPVQVLDVTGKPALGGIVAMSEGTDDTCALTSGGGVLCWGAPYNGDLGDGTGHQSEIPVQVSGLTSGVLEIGSGYRHNCAVTGSGGVLCWGFNITGQIGNGNTIDQPSPAPVVGVGGAGLLKLF